MPRSALQTALDIAAEHRARVAALEAENAALRERNAELVEGLRSMSDDFASYEDMPAAVDGRLDDCKDYRCQRTIGDLRRARALLQGEGGGDA